MAKKMPLITHGKGPTVLKGQECLNLAVRGRIKVQAWIRVYS